MKIAIISTPYYDFCASTLIEGLQVLSTIENIQFACTEKSNYAEYEDYSSKYLDEREFIKFANEADVIVETSNNGVKTHLLNDINHSEKLVYIDGEDVYHNKRDTKDFVLYFKREMRKSIQWPSNVRPFPFAAENRYFKILHGKRTIDVSCMFGPHDNTKSWRVDYQNTALDIAKENECTYQIGPIYGGSNVVESIDTGNRNHKNYYNILNQSLISIDAYGSYGCNSGRFWEILAAGACLFTTENLIHMPHLFEDGVNCIEYSNVGELKEKLRYCLKNREYTKNIAREGFLHLSKHHTTLERAMYFVDEIRKIGLAK